MKLKHLTLLAVLGLVGVSAISKTPEEHPFPPSELLIPLAAGASPDVPGERKREVQEMCRRPRDRYALFYCLNEAKRGWPVLLERYRGLMYQQLQ